MIVTNNSTVPAVISAEIASWARADEREHVRLFRSYTRYLTDLRNALILAYEQYGRVGLEELLEVLNVVLAALDGGSVNEDGPSPPWPWTSESRLRNQLIDQSLRLRNWCENPVEVARGEFFIYSDIRDLIYTISAILR